MDDFMDEIVYTTEVNRYAFFEKNSPSEHTRKCIDGRVTGSSKCVGYCQYKEHSGFLTPELLAQHDCIKKGCDYFIAKRREQRVAEEINDMSSMILSHAQKSLSRNEGVKIIRVKNTEFKEYTISYITITNDYNLDDYIEVAQKLFGVEVTFVKLNYDFEVCVELLCEN